jgi:hypothetical protein
MSWIIWNSIMRMGYPETGPMWRTKPDVVNSREEGEVNIGVKVLQFVDSLNKSPDVVRVKSTTDSGVWYVIHDPTHPDGIRDVHASWACYPAGFNPNDLH